MNNPIIWISILVVMNVIWAGSYSVMKYGLADIDPLSLVYLRFVTAFLIMCCWLAIRRVPMRVSRSDAARVIATGVLMGLGHWLCMTGVNMSGATDASLLYVFEPVFGILLATVFLGEKMRFTTVIGLILVFVGLAGLSGFDLGAFGLGGSVGMGNMMMVASMLCESLFSIVLKPVASRQPAPLVLTGVLFVAIVTLTFPVFGRPEGLGIGEISGAAIFAIVYLGVICTVVGYTLWVGIMKHVPVGIMLFTIFIQPISGPIIAWLSLNEKIDGRTLVGGSFLLAGMFAAVLGHFILQRRARTALEDEIIPVVGGT